MIRSVLLALGLAGCDLVFPTTHPQHDVDASPGSDGDIQHPPGDASCDLPVGQDELLTEGTYFVADRASGRAVKLSNGFVREVVGDVDTHIESDYHDILEPKPNGVESYDTPRLAPGGDELFLSMIDPSNNRLMGRSVRTANGWSIPTKAPVFDLDGSEIVDLGIGTPSPPTATSPRRMAMSFGADIAELEEQGGAWHVIHRYVPADLGANAADEAMLVPDGKHLVFAIGTGARMSDRGNISNTFSSSSLLYTGEIGYRSGLFYLEDCQRHLYYSKQFNIHRVVLP